MRRLWVLAVLVFVCLTASSVPHAGWLPFAPSGAAVAQSAPPATDLGAARRAITEQEAERREAAKAWVPVSTTDPEVERFKALLSAGLVLVVCAFGLAVILIMTTATRGGSKDQLLRSLIIVVIVVSSLVLIVAGFTNEQIAPAFGLFGTIVGYMLGRLNQNPDEGRPARPAGEGDAAKGI